MQTPEKLDIGVIGLGYVGVTTMACIAEHANSVVGVERDQHRNSQLKIGKIPFSEPKLDALYAARQSKISIVESVFELPDNISIFMICIGTPSDSNGNLYVDDVHQCIVELIEHIKVNNIKDAIISIRSTVPLGFCQQTLNVIDANCSDIPNLKPTLIYNPEFLREGKAIDDFMNPEVVVIGSICEKGKDTFKKIYSAFEEKIHTVGINEAEIIKSVNNSWHALKVCFANEIAMICEKRNIKTEDVFSMFHADKSLNISSAYLNPGFSFGGSCLKKDVKALVYEGNNNGLSLPVLENINLSNKERMDYILKDVILKKPTKVAVIGLAFKEDTDDFRLSTKILFAEKLIDHNIDIVVHDPVITDSIEQGRYTLEMIKSQSSVFEFFQFEFNEIPESIDLVICFNKSLKDHIHHLCGNHGVDLIEFY